MVIRFRFYSVLSPIGYDCKSFETYNINADTMAGSVASSVLSEINLTDRRKRRSGLLTQISVQGVKS